MPDLNTPHDALFRAAFEDPHLAAAFFREHLPNRIAAHLGEITPERIDGSFIDEALAGSQSDALFRVRTRTGDPAYLFLLEHKSTPDPGLPLQLASYMVRIWKRHAKEHGPAALPPIIPMVLYTGQRRWTVPDGLAPMIAGDAALSFLPGASYILRNIGEIPGDALARDAALKAVLLTLKREAMQNLAEVLESLPDELRRQVLHYIMRVYDDVELDGIRAALRRGKAAELEAYVGTIAETLIAEGKARGLAEGLAAGEAKGLAEGEAKGQATGKAKALTRLLTRRFGVLEEATRARIAAGSVADLDLWTDRLLEAPTLEAVFAPREH
ncbi:Rpn family recombination-promoting nuclease/putative transposase [Ruegeria sp.]|uniref:Rpn family recombination-promoting nuclease/putative transposase n=1 Tax=Ruegeria sp. TaxID=1879320 RepID=UPI003B00E380